MGIECRKSPEAFLVSKPAHERLVRKKGNGYAKMTEKYQGRASDISSVWPNVRKQCPEAERFSSDLIDVIGRL